MSLRGCSSIVGMLDDQLPMFHAMPAANTIQSWLLRVGLYELQRPKEQADDWVIMIDHTIQLGRMKCLLIVAIRQSAWENLCGTLKFEDLVLVDLQPVHKSDGELVFGQIQKASQKLGSIRAILSDQGSDIINGAKRFQEISPSTLILPDIAHSTATTLKHELLADSRWSDFVKLCGQTQPKVKQTELGYLAPPTMKIKGRYMNLGPLMGWGTRILDLLATPRNARPPKLDLTRLEDKYGWITEYREDMGRWTDLHEVKNRVLEDLRHNGYRPGAATELNETLSSIRSHRATDSMKTKLLSLVEKQTIGLSSTESLPASSEVLESLIGKGKRIQGQHSRGGFTKMILGMAASVAQRTPQRIRESLESVRDADLAAWCDAQFGQTLTSKRRQALAPSGTKPG